MTLTPLDKHGKMPEVSPAYYPNSSQDTPSGLQAISSTRKNLFSGLMQTYEENYLLLKRFLEKSNSNQLTTEHHLGKWHLLEFASIEHNQYTATILLAYDLSVAHSHPLVHPVRLKIRIYHDTCQAELLRFRGHSYKEITLNTIHSCREPLEKKWIINKFLNHVLLRLMVFFGGNHSESKN